MVKEIAKTDGDNTAGANIEWLIQQFWDDLPLLDKLRSAILINNYILRCTSLSQKNFSCTTSYMDGSIFIWQEVIASPGKYVEVSGHANTTINIIDYSSVHVGNAILYVL